MSEPKYTTKDGIPLHLGEEQTGVLPDSTTNEYADIVISEAAAAVSELVDYANEMRAAASNLTEENARLRAALLVAEHGLTTSHGLMTYDDGTPAGAKEHFRLDNTVELAAIKAALGVNL